ncbi:MAG: LysR substrate-binding domain-containing protein [Steroidobacteraceae bacterium]|jgi:LysR family transcriptional regulator for bpeEF and oprC
MDRFDQLRTFVRVADLGSFSRAADDLDRSRALVSQQVAALERRLGARLLNRTTRRVGLTGEGVEYLQRARRILAELEAADEAIMLTRERPQGRLRVDVPTAFGRHLLIPALPAFTRQYPQLVLEVQLNNRVVDLVAEEVDVALRVGAIRQGGLVARRVATMRLLTCASPGYLAQAGVPRSVDELREHRCIGVLSSESGRLRDWVFQRGSSRQRFRPACALAFNLPEAVISAGIADGGILQTVDLLVAGALANGKLRQVLPEFASEGPPISVVCTPQVRQLAKVRVFSDFAARLLRDWSQRIHARPGA